jgi:uncharacterized protein (TIGR04255 family)
MTEPTQFSNAPITEALLDIRVKLPAHIDLARIATFQDAVKGRYPARRERVLWQSQFQMQEGDLKISPPTGGAHGYLFASPDETQMVQVRLDGFTFNKLKPYDTWEALRDEARELWQHYIEIASPEVITRVALRYINRIEIPLPIRDFKDYILTTPEIAPDLPQALASLFMRLVIPVPRMQAIAVVTQAFDPPPETSEVLPLIFDIDVFREAIFDINSEEVWEILEKLRELKNEIFFKSITDRAKGLFQ